MQSRVSEAYDALEITHAPTFRKARVNQLLRSTGTARRITRQKHDLRRNSNSIVFRLLSARARAAFPGRTLPVSILLHHGLPL